MTDKDLDTLADTITAALSRCKTVKEVVDTANHYRADVEHMKTASRTRAIHLSNLRS
jgi:hypothetical protein